MKAADIFERLWIQYSCDNPSAGKIYDLFKKAGERVINDHVALRTFDDPRVSIDVIARPFLDAGYVPVEDYLFSSKKLRARHYEFPNEPEFPRVFISELILDQCSNALQQTVREQLDKLSVSLLSAPDLIFKGSIFNQINYSVYNQLREESEYAAWLYVFGYRANHFTVSINYLEHFQGIEEVNSFLKSKGFPMNNSGGEIKGTPEQLLEQSSTFADRIAVAFEDGSFVIPACYYEFARRYKDSDGNLFSGFIAESADKIFESTDFRK